MKKPLAITMGDSSGVGPEIVLRAYEKGELPRPAFVVGDLAALDYCKRALGWTTPVRSAEPDRLDDGVLNVLDLGLLRESDIEPGRISRKSGEAALRYVEAAARLALEGACSAIVTLPVNKEATRLSAPSFSGHTEFIAELCGAEHYTMMLASEQLIVTHVSTHVPLRQAIDTLAPERIVQVIRLTDPAVGKLRAERRIAVAGLNPHAGEGGAFGTEEEEQIRPAVEEARRLGFDVSGPHPPDTVFRHALQGKFDAVVCMYHDQGHIPLKLLDFEGGINVTLGLPVVRASVDHGTAFDIAYQGKAFTSSLRDACRMAARLATPDRLN